MDTKLTRFKINEIQKKHIFTLGVILFMLILAFNMIRRYHYVETKISEIKNDPFETEEYASDISILTIISTIRAIRLKRTRNCHLQIFF